MLEDVEKNMQEAYTTSINTVEEPSANDYFYEVEDESPSDSRGLNKESPERGRRFNGDVAVVPSLPVSPELSLFCPPYESSNITPAEEALLLPEQGIPLNEGEQPLHSLPPAQNRPPFVHHPIVSTLTLPNNAS